MWPFSGGGTMRTTKKSLRRTRSGAALIISMMFVLIFSALAVSIASLSNTNVQIAQNQHGANQARACAESGLEIVRYWLSRVSTSGRTLPNQVFSQIGSSLETALEENEISNIPVECFETSIDISTVSLDSTGQQSFTATITPIDADTMQADISGTYETVTRTIRANFQIGERANTAFDFGVATMGPLSLAGNIELEGINVSVEASVYIESPDSNLALSIIGNSQIAGDVTIVNPLANVYLQGGQAGIGGETGQDAIDNHVSFGVPPTDFPEPDPGYFEPYVINIVDANTDTSADGVYDNVRIAASTNPTFSGNVTLRGVVFIETPNVVTFSGNTNIIGIIVGNGYWEDDSAVNQIKLLGDVESLPVSELPEEAQFAGLHDDTGTFVVAPGFHVSFGGNFDTLNGAISANGIEFFGNAGGIINGSIINYSSEPMTLSGNSNLYFNRSGTNDVPPGFVPDLVLDYDPASYSEIAL